MELSGDSSCSNKGECYLTTIPKLVQDGVLELDDDINQRLRSWKVPDADRFTSSVSLRKILTHTAGLTVPGFRGYGPGESAPTTVGVLNGDGNTDPVCVDIEPGTQSRYSGGGYTVMQLLVEDMTETPFAQFMESEVLRPLGMLHSSFEQPLPERIRSEAASGYLTDGVAIEGRFLIYPEMAAAGLWTTPSDLACYLTSIQRARKGKEHPVLSSAMIEEMLTPNDYNRGLGPGVSEDGLRFGHGGSNAGFQCTMTAFLDRGQGIVVMTNSDNGGLLADEIVLTTAEEYGWEGLECPHKVIADLSTVVLDLIVGVYDASFGQVRIERRGDRLLASPFWEETEQIELLPESREAFFNREGKLSVTFCWSDDASVKGMKTFGLEFDKVQ